MSHEKRRPGVLGPYQIQEYDDEHTFSGVHGRCRKPMQFHVYLTSPVQQDTCRLPLVVLINGFQCRASWYKSYATYLASWGYHVLQYNTPALQLIADTVEIACLLDLIDDWLKSKDEDESSHVFRAIDWDNLLISGHSRGGKLATLVYAGTEKFKAAFLIDPVDNTKDSPESETSPSACKALKASGKRVAVMGAGLIGSCNPVGSNYKEFWAAAGKGSWLGVVPDAGHQQFLDAGRILNKGFDWLCKCGPSSRQDVAEAAQHAMLAWWEGIPGNTSKVSEISRAEALTVGEASPTRSISQ